jgi:hypothetical protein
LKMDHARRRTRPRNRLWVAERTPVRTISRPTANSGSTGRKTVHSTRTPARPCSAFP